MEEELGEPVPFWNWTEDDVPDLFEGITVPVKEGISAKCPCEATGDICGPSGRVTRRTDIKIDKEKLRKDISKAFDELDFLDFQDAIKKAHGEVHQSMGCELGAQMTASYDPLFWLHHSFVDSQWVYWSELQDSREHLEEYSVAEWDDPMPPFDRRELKNGFKNENERTLRNSRASATLDYKENLCYQYKDLQFDNKSPDEFDETDESDESSGLTLWSPIQNDVSSSRNLPPGECGKNCITMKELKGKRNCKEFCADVKSGALVNVYVGVVLPKEAPTGVNAFDLCQGGQCVKASHVSTFGIDAEHADKPSEPRIDKKNYKLTEVDVTAVMVREGWTLKKDLTAKMTSTVMDRLPEPVVILKEVGEGGKVVQGTFILSPKENRGHYGDLLDKYSSAERAKKVRRF